MYVYVVIYFASIVMKSTVERDVLPLIKKIDVMICIHFYLFWGIYMCEEYLWSKMCREH